MEALHLRRTLCDMYALVARGEGRADERDDADARFRAEYRRVWERRDAADVPAPVERALRQALIAIAGEDDWTRAREHLAQALELSER